MKFNNEPEKTTEEFKEELKKVIREKERELAFEKCIDKIRSANRKTFFLITYDFKDSNGKIKEELTSKHGFRDKVGKKSLPETTLIWEGAVTDKREDCFNHFKTIVKTIITKANLDTEFDKTIVIEILEPKAIIEDK